MSDETKPTRLAIAAGNRGLQLTSLDDYWRFATAVTRSGMAPKGVDTPDALVVAMQLGAELGLSPMASVQNIAVINGRPSVWGDAMLAICQGSGLFDDASFTEELIGTPMSDNWTGVCTCRRFGNGKLVRRGFSVTQAKRAGLWGKRGPWTEYPQRMLQMRARSWALRDCFADVLKGVYTREEARDIVVDHVPHVPSEDHLAQAEAAREAELPDGNEKMFKDSDLHEGPPAADLPGDPIAPTSEGEEEGYGLMVEDADTINALVSLQASIDGDGVMADAAKERLEKRITARRDEIRAARGSRSNEPKGGDDEKV